LKANISEELIERVAKINGKPIVRGMDKAINECLDLLENKTVTTDEEGNVAKVETCDRLEELVKNG